MIQQMIQQQPTMRHIKIVLLIKNSNIDDAEDMHHHSKNIGGFWKNCIVININNNNNK